jgi:DNA (cytosine-5)-methyltransferase 1
LTLFSGAGGLSLGFQAAGAHILAAVDANEDAGRSFQNCFARLQPRRPPRAFFGEAGDIENLDLEQVAPVGKGPRHPGGRSAVPGLFSPWAAKLASLAGDADPGDPRNQLYRRFVDATRLWAPRAVVIENVPGMLSLQGTNVADAVASDLAACGYRVGYALLNAVWYGVPQFRERLFFVGIREDLTLVPSMPDATHHVELPIGYLRPTQAITLSFAFAPHFELEVRTAGAKLPATSVGDALDDLPPIKDHLSVAIPDQRRRESRHLLPYQTGPDQAFARLMRAWPGLPEPAGVRDHVSRQTPRDFETFRRMRPDDRYPEAMRLALQRLEEELARRATAGEVLEPGSPAHDTLRDSIVPPYPVEKFVDKWRKLNARRPSWTVPAHLSHDTYSHIHHDSGQARTISVREAARLQSFPDAFEFSGNMGSCYTQIGNAVPPVLAWAIASHLLRQLGFRSEPCPLSCSNDVLGRLT